mgnify:CR=1 FL=1
MNRSKIITATALATVMTAGAAQAEMSIGGLFAGTIYDNPGAATSHAESTNSIYVTYSDSMDNGMGVSVAMSISKGGANKADVNIDTGFGTIGLGDGQDSAVDTMDGSPAVFSVNPYGPRFTSATPTTGIPTAGFNDGDAASGNSLAYTSPAVNGFTAKITRGFENATTDPTMSYAISGSVMGVGIKAGVSSIDRKASGAQDQDPSFFTASYSIAGLDLGYAMYDDDDTNTNGEETQMGVGTSLMGSYVGVTFAERDTSTVDTDYMLVSVTKSMGAASFGLDYLETDASNASATDTFAFTYVVGF